MQQYKLFSKVCTCSCFKWHFFKIYLHRYLEAEGQAEAAYSNSFYKHYTHITVFIKSKQLLWTQFAFLQAERLSTDFYVYTA